MKKILSLAFMFVFVMSLLIGCGGGGNSTGGAASGGSTTGSNSSSNNSSSSSSSSSNSTSNNASEVNNIVYKDTIIYAVNGDQATMDPHMNVNNDKVLPWVYSKLITRDMNSKIVGDAAESWSVADDEVTWTFNLRKGIKFHNGKEMTARDVKASYDRLLFSGETFRYTPTMNYIAEVKIIDDYTVQIITTDPIGPFEGLTTGSPNSILDSDYIEKYGRDLGTSPESINGTGPYKMLEWNKDEYMKFEAHADYAAGGFSGPPVTKYLIHQVIPEQNSRAIAVETGQVDMADNISPADAVRLDKVSGIKVEKVPARGMHLFQFNCSKEPMRDPKIRQAICYAVDKVTMVETLFGELGEKPVTNPVSTVCFGYNDLGVFPYDPAKSRELLAEAGYPNGFDIVIMTTPSYNQAVAQAEIIAQYLKEVGLNPTIEVVESAVFNAFQGAGPEGTPWHMFIMGSGSASLDSDSYLRRIFQTEAGGNNVNNYGFYSNLEFDRLVDEAYKTTNIQKRLDNYLRAQTIVYLEDPVGVFVNYRNNIFAMDERMEGFASNLNFVTDLTVMRIPK